MIATPDELSAATQAVIAQLLEIEPSPVFAAYDAAMVPSVDMCPYQTETIAESTGVVHYWDGLCETLDSIAYKGPMTTWDWTDNTIDATEIDLLRGLATSSPGFDGYRVTGRGISGQTDIYSADSSFDFNCSCAMAAGEGVNDAGDQLHFHFMQGRASWTGEEVVGTWVDAGISPGYFLHVIDYSSGGRLVTASGNLYGHADRFDAAVFRLSLDGTQPDAARCQSSVSSLSMELRDGLTAHWYSISFNIGGDATRCTGSAVGDGGPISVDLSGFFSVEFGS